MSAVRPRRGEVWVADLGTPVGRKAGFERPVLVVSADAFSASGLVVVLPVTTTSKAERIMRFVLKL